jgi:N-acetylmuramoyl-L-alanine amidase
MTRTNDEFVSLSKRAEIANNENVDIFISVHINSSSSATANGFEIYHCQGSTNGKKLAECISRKITNIKNRGVKSSRFQVLVKTNMPAVLVECGFISNNNDLKLMMNDEWVELFANSLAQGLEEYNRMG